jgi:hypothetical protein
LKIAYTVENGKIKIKNFDLPGKEIEFVKVYNNCLPVISFFHMKGNLHGKVCCTYNATPENGIILSVQMIPENHRFEFESSNNISVNFAPEIKSIQLMVTSYGFKHGYENPGSINRFDIFIPAAKAATLLPLKIVQQLSQQKILNLSSCTNDSALAESLNRVVKELEKPESKALCAYVEALIQAITV